MACEKAGGHKTRGSIKVGEAIRETMPSISLLDVVGCTLRFGRFHSFVITLSTFLVAPVTHVKLQHMHADFTGSL